MGSLAVSSRWWIDTLARRAIHTLGFLGGFVSTLAGSSLSCSFSRQQKLLRLQSSEAGELTHRAGGFINFRSVILGCNREQVRAALGPPRVTAILEGDMSVAASQRPGYDQLDQWYYVFDPSRQGAVVLVFSLGRVRRVQFLDAPDAFD